MRHIFFLILLLSSCTSSERKKTSYPIKEEKITRKSDDCHYPLTPPQKIPLPTYPWIKSDPPKITKDFFRCKGNCFHPSYTYEEETLTDCNGFKGHSLPIRDGQEFIYPILIYILNFIQDETKKPVTITSGHRCPKHNTYVDPPNIYSKHMIGAEVSFYVEGEDPTKLIQLIQDYYKVSDYSIFRRFEGKTDVSTPPWHNKEIFIKLFKEHEGRNLDNDHSFPYINIQVKYDRELDETVSYTWRKANRGYFQR